jgi:hypothetical protein
VVVHFVDISGIVDYHCLNYLLIHILTVGIVEGISPSLQISFPLSRELLRIKIII